MRADFSGKRVTVMGLGRFSGGVGVAKYLVKRGAVVTVTDLAGPETLKESMDRLAGLPIAYRLGEHRDEDFTRADLVVVGPGVPKDSAYLAAAGAAGVPTTAEMSLFLAECAGKVVGVTGSNGKSTTTAMVGAVLSRKYKTWVGGNIGASLLECVEDIRPGDRVALEMSSFQLEDLAPTKLSPPTAVVTNLTPNHLDRHGSLAEYADAKKNIFRFQRRLDWLVLNAEDPLTKDWQRERRGHLARFSMNRPEDGAVKSWIRGEQAQVDCSAFSGRLERYAGPLMLKVPGRHNRANALAALATAATEGVPLREALAALADFRGLPDRLELVAEVDGIRYYNDSIATTPESVFAALDAFTEPKVCIVGGYNKNLDLSGLAKALTERAKAVVLIGKAADEIEGLIGSERDRRAKAAAADDDSSNGRLVIERPTPSVVVARAAGMEDAVRRSAELARSGDVVLMSPACASFDMFTNYRHRGEVFRQCVKRLAGMN
jgi:UDP-N-acetylmuramoylalanine--D-glutamate ligase